ncbi:MAG TPA: hypothetical protein EYO73_01780 [Sulfurimonas sp.]|nr:hypothetical protein [Sulfurimonas sp.]
MIDGIIKGMDKDINRAISNGVSMDEKIADEIRRELITCYTIQEQRDYVMGVEDAFSQACDLNNKPLSDLEEFTLF